MSTWDDIVAFFTEKFGGKKPDLNAILFLIGIRELGILPEKEFSKEEKVELIHIATCRILSFSGHYRLIGKNLKGYPQWELTNPIPNMGLFEQESYLRAHIIEYFKQEELLPQPAINT